ncbi:predicted protein [Nematostella vectensis]|uniref:DAZ-associated protein 2 n=1 Tax=Nematostella vectensis TaxID=45351 RepID=A7SFD6_NEMVE|nr:DAZ-associated protein 2 [Nematostella vectensis]EDO37623.1 predicted protein [Nematostella vectensis]|eukprot:XP_001629686.1 predicted protein [Nematostella vectensis]
MSKQTPGNYPQKPQQPYPAQPSYPQQSGGYPQANFPQASPQQAGYQQSYGVPPPAYSPYPQSGPVPQHPPQQFYPTQQPPAQYPQYAAPISQGTFDPGARFGPGTGASPNVPPPPPGCMPTAAQVAASQGQSVVMNQGKEGWFSGGSDGGYTIW